jgi:hypothetical protein
MTLEKSHLQVTKRSNTDFVDDRYLWIEDHTTFEKFHFMPPKCRTEAVLILWVEILKPLGYPSLDKGITKNAFTKYMSL